MPIEHIRLSKQARDQLIKLKRWTGLKNWNVLCRWALSVSLAEPTPPSITKIPADGSVEMTWKVFGGTYADVYWSLLIHRCQQDGIEPTEDNLHQQFRTHLHRGISYLAGDRSIRSIADLLAKVARRGPAAPELPMRSFGEVEPEDEDTDTE